MRADATKAVISHREYIADIPGSVLFDVNEWSLNPGNPLIFKWLSQIAINYESYRFSSLTFHYETAVSTITPGTVMLAVDYDAADPAPSDKQGLMSYAQAQRSAAWSACAFNCRQGDLKKFAAERYVRGSSLPTGDPKTYDVGKLFLATQGNTDTTLLGELYVTYTVELRTPQTSNNVVVAQGVDNNVGQWISTTPTPITPALTLFDPLATGTETFSSPSVEYKDGVMTLDPSATYLILATMQNDDTGTVEWVVDVDGALDARYGKETGNSQEFHSHAFVLRASTVAIRVADAFTSNMNVQTLSIIQLL